MRTIIKFSGIVGNKEKENNPLCALHLASYRHGYKAHSVSFTVDVEQSIQERSTILSQYLFLGELCAGWEMFVFESLCSLSLC